MPLDIKEDQKNTKNITRLLTSKLQKLRQIVIYLNNKHKRAE